MDVAIRDEDLKAQLEKARRGSPGYETLVGLLQKQQVERDAERMLSPVQRRRVEARRAFEAEGTEEKDLHFIHSVLGLCGLPYRKPKDADVFTRQYGRNSLVVQAGYLADPVTGTMVKQGLPYGPKARLVLTHLCTQAVRQQSAEINIADSMSAFIRVLGFPVTGGERGTLTQFKEQIHRIAASRMQIGMWREGGQTTVNAQTIESFDIWLPQHPDQRMLWSSTLKLDDRFYQSLREHAMPVHIRVLHAFSQSARQMDLVTWLGYRLYSLKAPTPISWEALQTQFGEGIGRARRFRSDFREDLEAVIEVFPKLPVYLNEHGIMLHPCAPEELFVPTRNVQARIKWQKRN
jgi:hypothetical protein